MTNYEKQGGGPVKEFSTKKREKREGEECLCQIMAPEHHPATFKVKFS